MKKIILLVFIMTFGGWLVRAQQPDCWASFIYYPDSLDFFTWHFVDQSGVANGTTPDSWYWDFGDGSFSSDQNPTHTYASEGIYIVCLTITDDESNCENTFCLELMIPGGPSGCDNYFTYQTNDGYTFAFTGSVNSTNPASYFWDFGDGTTGEGQYVTHTFPMEPPVNNMYTVCLTTFTIDSISDSCYDVSCQQVFTGGPMDCQAWFYYFPADSLNTGLAYQFIDNSIGIHDSWLWDLGDGTSSIEQNPIHTYLSEGTYMVCLAISDSTGECQSTFCSEVWVGIIPPPTGCENFFTFEQIEPLTYTFSGEAMYGGIIIQADAYIWDFGDGITGEGQIVTHTFNGDDPISYLVCLTTCITDPILNDSCFAVSCQEIGIGGGNEVYTLFGQVIMGNSFADAGQVSLYMFNPSGEMTLLAVQPVDSIGHYFFPEVITGNYYILAELLPASSQYGNYLPTYYGDAITWTEAEMITLGEPLNPYNINLVPVNSYNPGPGVINGSINMNYGLFRDGEPASDVEIILMDHNDQAIEYVYSTEEGAFDFTTLDWGTYKVHAEVPGKLTAQALVTLDEENPSITVAFMITLTEVYNSLSIDERSNAALSVGDVYPNPVLDVATVPVTLIRASVVSIRIINQLGQEVMASLHSFDAGSHMIPLNLSGLRKGVYTLMVTSDGEEMFIKKIVK